MSGPVLGLLAESAVRITGAALLVGALLFVLRVRASAARHAAWTIVLGAMLLMPLLTSWLPGLAVPLPPAAAQVTLFPGLDQTREMRAYGSSPAPPEVPA